MHACKNALHLAALASFIDSSRKYLLFTGYAGCLLSFLGPVAVSILSTEGLCPCCGFLKFITPGISDQATFCSVNPGRLSTFLRDLDIFVISALDSFAWDEGIIS